MDSTYTRLNDDQRQNCCIPWFRRNNTDDSDEDNGLDIKLLIKGLNVKLIGQFSKLQEQQKRAKQYFDKGDKLRAEIELRLFLRCKQEYTQRLKLYERAQILNNDIESIHDNSIIHNTFKKEMSDTTLLQQRKQQIEELELDWNTVQVDDDVIQQQMDKEQDDLHRVLMENLIDDMPSVPKIKTEKEKEKEKKELIAAK